MRREDFQALVQFLTPYFATDQRQSILRAALYGTPLLKQVEWTGDDRAFTTRFVQVALTHGEIASGLPAMVAVLEELRFYVGVNHHPTIDGFIRGIRDNTSSETVSENVPERIRNYEIIAEAGQGGFSRVYRAYQPSIRREVAIKVIRPEHASQRDFMERFHMEAEMIGRLEHPHIVPLYDFWTDNNGAYLVMRWMKGGTLGHHMGARGGKLGVDQVRIWFQQLTEAIHTAHRNGIVHRDIKPANILLDEELRAYLADFGISKDVAFNNIRDLSSPFTPTYAAPEQIGGESITFATDIYCLGIMLYEMLTGQPPFRGGISTVLRAHIQDELPSVLDENPDLPSAVDEVLRIATKKEPENRYPDVLAFQKAFAEAFEQGRAVRGGAVLAQPDIQHNNPFFHRGPIKDPTYFFGRRDSANQLANLISNGQSASIVGQRRFGKTSLLFSAYNRADLTDRMGNNVLVFVFIDCGLLTTADQDEIYRVLLEEIEDTMDERGLEFDDFRALGKDNITFRDVERDLRRLSRKGYALVLLLDEFERLSLNEYVEVDFFTGLRALAMRYPLVYITASREPLIELTYADESALTSPFFNIFATIRLDLFSESDATDMLTTLSGRTAYPFDRDTATYLAQVAGGNPIFTQIAGYLAVEQLFADGTLDWSALERDIVAEARPHLEYYWRNLTVDAQRTLALLGTGADVDSDILRDLERLCLVRRTADDTVIPFADLFAAYVAHQRVPGLMRSGAVVVDDRNGRLYNGAAWTTPSSAVLRLLVTLLPRAGEQIALDTLATALDLSVADLTTVTQDAWGILGDHAGALVLTDTGDIGWQLRG
jgi:serine/threonine protein kinase